MGNADKQHFEEYRAQNRVKHTILTKYIFAFLNVIKTQPKAIFYIDGFAGQGHYGDPDKDEAFAGSPIRALQEICRRDDLRQRVRTWFIEQDADFFENLSASVESFLKVNKGLHPPVLKNCRFTDALGPVIKEIQAGQSKLKPTFLFVDPCGVDDVSMEIISGVLQQPWCEVLVFFNYMGVNRICGLFGDDRATPSLTTLFGNEERVEQLRGALDSRTDPVDREKVIVAQYIAALREDGTAEYIVPFRVEQENRKATSHYLIHASKHPLGFRIMKEVMWNESRVGNDSGRLEFLQASRTDQLSLLHPETDEIDRELLKDLSSGPQNVRTYIEQKVSRPHDLFDAKVYKDRVIELESQGAVAVFEPDGVTPKPALKRTRKKRNSVEKEVTLGPSLVISLA